MGKITRGLYLFSILIALSSCAEQSQKPEISEEAVELTSQERSEKAFKEMMWADTIEGYEPLSNSPKIISSKKVGDEVHVVIKNTGSTTLQYSAVGQNSLFNRGPDYIRLFQEVDESGKWQRGYLDFCGTGKEMFDLKPNGFAELRVIFWDPEKRERMSGLFSEKGTSRRSVVALATEP